jgi:hypothetical protein
LGFLSGAGAFAQDLVVTFLVYSALAHCEKKNNKTNKNNKTKDENKQRERKVKKKRAAAARRKEGSMWHSLTHRPPLNFGSFGC